jgi:hypothetical protein
MAEENAHHGQQAAGGPAARGGKTRRRLLAGAAGVLGLAAAEVAGKAAPAQANTGNPVLQGIDNGYPTHRTGVFTPNNAEVGILADPNSSGKGSLGVYGIGQAIGVLGECAGDGHGLVGTGADTGSGLVAQGAAVTAQEYKPPAAAVLTACTPWEGTTAWSRSGAPPPAAVTASELSAPALRPAYSAAAVTAAAPAWSVKAASAAAPA